jgi:hypothetical protein
MHSKCCKAFLSPSCIGLPSFDALVLSKYDYAFADAVNPTMMMITMGTTTARGAVLSASSCFRDRLQRPECYHRQHGASIVICFPAGKHRLWDSSRVALGCGAVAGGPEYPMQPFTVERTCHRG